MISSETRVQIRHWFYAEHWKIGTIAQELGVHPDTVRSAIESNRFHRAQTLRPCLTDPYLPFIRQTLDLYPRLRATRIYQMLRERGYQGSVVQLRRAVANLRPQRPEPFLRLHMFPAEQAQVDWAHFGEVRVGRARRRLSCFVITLAYSRALYLEFFFDQTMENFLRGHVHAFQAWAGSPRVILHDNLRSAVLERRGNQIHFHPRLLELCAHYHCIARPCQVRAGNQNVLGHFVEDELTEHDKLKAPCGQMYEHYKSWADKNGEYQMTSTEFKGRMEQRYGDAGRSGEGKFWKGVGITILSEKDKWMLEEKTVEEMVSAIQ